MKILLVVYDNGSYAHVFPMGMGAIAGVLEKEGHDDLKQDIRFVDQAGECNNNMSEAICQSTSR